MYENKKLAQKLALQRVRNAVAKIRGILLLSIEEDNASIAEKLARVGFCSSEKMPDSALPSSSAVGKVIEWIAAQMSLCEQSIYYLYLENCLVKFKLIDINTAVHDFWCLLSPDSRGFTLLSEDKQTAFDVASDSRDEEHYLFDVYHLPAAT